jgi:tRNA1Val (adenine37-N6)-methyltransferase
MTDARPFHFKHFSLYHHRSTMKVGTDAVLLGRWVEVWPTDVVLDIGTGCGILPLMLAQKGISQADAVDLDSVSIDEATVNFKASQWRDQLQAYCSDIADFQTDKKYDLIISNPPFFIRSFKCDADRKNRARHTDVTLSFDVLCESVCRLMEARGRFAVVLPVNESMDFQKVADSYGLYLSKRMTIIPIEGKEPNRVNLELQFMQSAAVLEETFVIRRTDNRFTDQYNEFLKEYYLGL